MLFILTHVFSILCRYNLFYACVSGIGSRLHVYRVQPVVEHIGTYSVLPGTVIHGIRQGKLGFIFLTVTEKSITDET